MSAVNSPLDLTSYGCPLHYIKAREALQQIAVGEVLILLVNPGNATDKLLKSLGQDGQLCEIQSEDILTTTIRVTRNDRDK